MSEQSIILQRMEKIRFVFQHAMQFSSSNDNDAVDAYLKNVEPEFRAVAFEGAAMSFALKDLHDRALIDWRAFMRRSEQPYVPHVHVGLGWAIARQKLPSLIFLDSMRPSMLFRVLDGYGYYDGIFRQVQTINSQSRASSIESIHYAGYDQGVGRSLWYSAGGDVIRLSDSVRKFPGDRQGALWRGVGIAVAFVGGCDENKLESLIESAGSELRHLSFGAALAIKARVATDTVSADTILAGRMLCNISVNRVNELISGLESSSDEDTYPLFMSRLLEIESELARNLKTAGVHKENE
jgi:enediyne biosynthesis protein E3